MTKANQSLIKRMESQVRKRLYLTNPQGYCQLVQDQLIIIKIFDISNYLFSHKLKIVLSPIIISFNIQGLLKMEKTKKLQIAGSCAIVSLIVNDNCYIANTGDSRAIVSCIGGNRITQLSCDHRPSYRQEYCRVLNNGGQLVRPEAKSADQSFSLKKALSGPMRVIPGRLAVTRAFGDFEAKLEKFGGNPCVIICTPEVRCFKIDSNTDFLILGCDGVFDKISNEAIISLAWKTAETSYHQGRSIEEVAGDCVSAILNECFNKIAHDNITVVFIAFDGFERNLQQKPLPIIQAKSQNFNKESNSKNLGEDSYSPYISQLTSKRNSQRRLVFSDKK